MQKSEPVFLAGEHLTPETRRLSHSLASGLTLEHLPTTPLCLDISTETQIPAATRDKFFCRITSLGILALHFTFLTTQKSCAPIPLVLKTTPPLIFQLQLQRDASVPICSHKSCAVVCSSWTWWPESKALFLDIPEAGIKGMAGGRAAVPRAMGSILLAGGEGQQGSILPSSTSLGTAWAVSAAINWVLGTN